MTGGALSSQACCGILASFQSQSCATSAKEERWLPLPLNQAQGYPRYESWANFESQLAENIRGAVRWSAQESGVRIQESGETIPS